MRNYLLFAALPLCFLACSSESSPTSGSTSGEVMMTDKQYEEQAVKGMHDALLADIVAMETAATDLKNAAPTPPNTGWDPVVDAKAIADMKAAWIRARNGYELAEGALAPLFPVIDHDIDARYDDFMTDLAAQGGDKNLFDDVGVTGMHGIERIIFLDTTPQRVVDFEKVLPGYMAAALPATAAEAADFKTKLCEKFITDSKALRAEWTPVNINVAIAFHGLISLVAEQREKVQKASSNEEESRYSQRTMVDLRDNLTGSKTVYALFQPWILSKSNAKDPTKDGKTIDAKILKGLAALDTAYQAVSGDAIPTPPPTWSAENPTPADLMTPFGKLYTAVQSAVDATLPDSVVSQMNVAATLLGFPVF